MSYKLKCKCGATAWVPGSYDPETNATELNDCVELAMRDWEWDCGACNGTGTIQKAYAQGEHGDQYQEPCEDCGGTGYAKGCDHNDFEIVAEQDDYYPDLEAYLERDNDQNGR